MSRPLQAFIRMSCVVVENQTWKKIDVNAAVRLLLHGVARSMDGGSVARAYPCVFSRSLANRHPLCEQDQVTELNLQDIPLPEYV